MAAEHNGISVSDMKAKKPKRNRIIGKPVSEWTGADFGVWALNLKKQKTVKTSFKLFFARSRFTARDIRDPDRDPPHVLTEDYLISCLKLRPGVQKDVHIIVRELLQLFPELDDGPFHPGGEDFKEGPNIIEPPVDEPPVAHRRQPSYDRRPGPQAFANIIQPDPPIQPPVQLPIQPPHDPAPPNEIIPEPSESPQIIPGVAPPWEPEPIPGEQDDEKRPSPPPPGPIPGPIPDDVLGPDDDYKDYGNEFEPELNRFLPGVVRYPRFPAINGPKFEARMKGTRPEDEPRWVIPNMNELERRFADQLLMLQEMGHIDHKRNVRLLQHFDGDTNKSAEYYLNTTDEIQIGCRVVRNIDWIWGNQDGGEGHMGVVRGIRKWHPLDDRGTEVVVHWDNSRCANYRWGHEGAYDVHVVRPNRRRRLRELHIGETVVRGPDWKEEYGDQDGGDGNVGVIIEVYSSPSAFKPGCRAAVLWDCQEEKYLMSELERRHQEKARKDADDYDEARERAETEKKFPEGKWYDDDLDTRPPVRYNWGLDDKYDVRFLSETRNDRPFLQVGDAVEPGPDHVYQEGEPRDWTEGIVMRVERWDTLSDVVQGDKITLVHNPKLNYKFGYQGKYEIQLKTRGMFTYPILQLRVGDRVQRGVTWDPEIYKDEDGGDGRLGTVVALHNALQLYALLAKVRWPNGTTNLYSWGFRDKFEIRRAANDAPLLMN